MHKAGQRAFVGFLAGVAVVAMASVSLAAEPRAIRIPLKKWALQAEGPNQDEMILVSGRRIAAIDLSVVEAPPKEARAKQILQLLVPGASLIKITKFPAEQAKSSDLQNVYILHLTDGRRAMYASKWKTRADGRYSVTSYMGVAQTFDESNTADLKLMRALYNQLSRGAVLRRPEVRVAGAEFVPQPAQPSAIQPPAIQSPAVQPTTMQPALPAVVQPAPRPAVAENQPSAAAPGAMNVPTTTLAQRSVPTVNPQPQPQPQPASAAVNIPGAPPLSPGAGIGAKPPVSSAVGVLTRSKYPYSAPGKGVGPSAIAAVIYSPLEASEVFVLFKDGSFHEELPVALEDWNVAQARQGEPESWGKWKRSGEAGEFDLEYAQDDVSTISGSVVKPIKAGHLLDGQYALDLGLQGVSKDQLITFDEDRFTLQRGGNQASGKYQLSGYSITMNFDDGNNEKLPFFLIAPEDDDDDEEASIWLGDAVHVRVN